MEGITNNSMRMMEKSMEFLWAKQTALLDNIANAETPNYRAKLVTFEEEFQRELEGNAYALGGGGYRAPAQRVGDFLAGLPSSGPGQVRPSYRPGVAWTDLRRCLPPFAADALAEALPILGQKLRGYDDPDAVLTAVESRSSSPVRILRDETLQSNIRGLYPCGEGAGYAGGILSAAADGIRCAEALCQSCF